MASDLTAVWLPADVRPYMDEIHRTVAVINTAIAVDAAMTDFIEDGGDPWEVLAGERALLGREISPLEVAEELVALTS